MPKELPFIYIAGPTATGKTRTAAHLARLIGGEVISADSMQIYKYMDIGTAKPTSEETLGVPHHLIDELYPDEPYSAYEFKKRAEERAATIRARGGYPIVCGGTGFYLNALMYGARFTEYETDHSYRAYLYEYLSTHGAAALHDMLRDADPVSAKAIHANNVKRVIRALEYFKQNNNPISAHNAELKARRTGAKPLLAVLSMDRGRLYQRINTRVDDMFTRGLENEVRGLLDRGYGAELVSMQGLGYKETVRYIRGDCGYAEAADDIKTGTRRFAKRQITWFRGQCEGLWVVADDAAPAVLAERIALEFGL